MFTKKAKIKCLSSRTNIRDNGTLAKKAPLSADSGAFLLNIRPIRFNDRIFWCGFCSFERTIFILSIVYLIIGKYLIQTITIKIMKKSIKLSALLLLFSTGLFAATPKTTVKSMPPGKKDYIVFNTLPSQRGIDLIIQKAEMGKTIVIIYDDNGNVLRKDVLNNLNKIRKGYVLNQLDNGDYSIEIISKNQVFKRSIHVYNEGPIKSFIVRQV